VESRSTEKVLQVPSTMYHLPGCTILLIAIQFAGKQSVESSEHLIMVLTSDQQQARVPLPRQRPVSARRNAQKGSSPDSAGDAGHLHIALQHADQ